MAPVFPDGFGLDAKPSSGDLVSESLYSTPFLYICYPVFHVAVLLSDLKDVKFWVLSSEVFVVAFVVHLRFL